jgi:hypothetical protein
MATPGRPRQVSIPDNMWEIFTAIENESGNNVDVLVNQAMFEMAVRLGYVSPVPQEAQPPISDEEMPRVRESHAPASKSSAKETAGQKGAASSPPPAPAAKRPPRPAPKPTAPAPAGRPSSPPAAKGEAKGLFIVNEDGDTEKIDKDIYIIGRSSKCDLVINSVKVSREHAIITRERGEYFIEDLGSANGTWYKGERIEKMKLKDGDEIFICDEKFKFVVR